MTEYYENGPDGMPRVERMTRSTIMAVLSQKDVPTIYVSREEDYNSLCKFAHAVAEETLARVPAWPAERTTSPVIDAPDTSQDWAKLDGATAFHLIERHAENWSETGRMMETWLAARSAFLAKLAAAAPHAQAPAHETVVQQGDELVCTACGTTSAAPVAEPHPDDIAVDKFAAAMKAKMASSRAKGRGGWDDPAQCDVADLCSMLVDHIDKGDPVDVGNFAMMLFNRGVRSWELPTALAAHIAPANQPQPVAEQGELPRFIANPDEFQTSILHAMYRCAQRGESVERMHFDVCQIIAASQQAAEPVAWSYECQQNAAGTVWAEFINRTKPKLTERDGVRNIKPLYAAPAIQQPQDEREAFEAEVKRTSALDLTPSVQRNQYMDGCVNYAWVMWQARAALAKKGGAA